MESVFQKSKKNNYLNDYSRNVKYGNDKLNCIERNSFTNYKTDRDLLGGEISKYKLGVNRSNYGVKMFDWEPLKTTQKEMNLEFDNSGNIGVNVKNGGYNSQITDFDPRTTLSEIYVENKYKPHVTMNKNAGYGYITSNYNANTTLKELSTQELERQQANRPFTKERNLNYVSTDNIPDLYEYSVKPNTMFKEHNNEREFNPNNLTRIIISKEHIGDFYYKNNEFENFHSEQLDIVNNQLKNNPFTLQTNFF
jgi:hypothetical protein